MPTYRLIDICQGAGASKKCGSIYITYISTTRKTIVIKINTRLVQVVIRIRTSGIITIVIIGRTRKVYVGKFCRPSDEHSLLRLCTYTSRTSQRKVPQAIIITLKYLVGTNKCIVIILYHRALLVWLLTKTAFLCGDLEEPMHMKPPAGHSVPPNTILKLNKAICGLVIASRQWHNKWTHHLMNNCGFKQSWTEPRLFWRVRSNQERVYLVVHVDDCLLVGTRLGIDNAIADISNEARGGFKIKRLGNKFQSHLRCDIRTVKQGLVFANRN